MCGKICFLDFSKMIKVTAGSVMMEIWQRFEIAVVLKL